MLVITETDSKAPVHIDLTRRELAEFVLGKRVPVGGGDALAELDRPLDRSHLMQPMVGPATVLQRDGKTKCNDGLEHWSFGLADENNMRRATREESAACNPSQPGENR